MPLDKFKCWYCGKELEYDSEPQTRVYCADCYAKAQEEQKQLLKEHIERRIRVMYGHALTKMERAGVYMHEYAEIAPRLLERALKDPERFLSSYEMISAMVLESNGYEFEVNKRIGKHMVDFYVPEMKVIYEVDGDRHEFSALEDGRRDMALREQLGADWEIVRIPTQYIEQNPEMIPEALEQMRAYKRKMRKDYCGHLPDGFSKREKALYDKIRQYNTKKVWK
jgi:very-short-patch-repair endonuclease